MRFRQACGLKADLSPEVGLSRGCAVRICLPLRVTLVTLEVFPVGSITEIDGVVLGVSAALPAHEPYRIQRGIR